MELVDFLEEWNNEKTIIEVKTSGSTGAPKPLHIAKTRMLSSARMTCDFLQLVPKNTALLCLPLEYIAGKMMVVRSIERQLELITIPPTSHPLSDENWEQYGQGLQTIDFAAMVPLQVYNTLLVPTEKARLQTIRHLIIGGAAIDERLEEQLRHFPNAIWSTYGMTETLSHIALRRINGANASLWYTPLNGVNIALSEDGSLVIDAPNLCAEKLYTNDIAVLETVGKGKSATKRFRIIGRKDNVVNSGGIKIQIEQVEALLKKHILNPFALTKRPNSILGEELVLVYVGVNSAELKRVCETYLPRYWQPQSYIQIDAMPMTETGKVARNTLEQLVANM